MYSTFKLHGYRICLHTWHSTDDWIQGVPRLPEVVTGGQGHWTWAEAAAARFALSSLQTVAGCASAFVRYASFNVFLPLPLPLVVVLLCPAFFLVCVLSVSLHLSVALFALMSLIFFSSVFPHSLSLFFFFFLPRLSFPASFPPILLSPLRRMQGTKHRHCTQTYTDIETGGDNGSSRHWSFQITGLQSPWTLQLEVVTGYQSITLCPGQKCEKWTVFSSSGGQSLD